MQQYPLELILKELDEQFQPSETNYSQMQLVVPDFPKEAPFVVKRNYLLIHLWPRFENHKGLYYHACIYEKKDHLGKPQGLLFEHQDFFEPDPGKRQHYKIVRDQTTNRVYQITYLTDGRILDPRDNEELRTEHQGDNIIIPNFHSPEKKHLN